MKITMPAPKTGPKKMPTPPSKIIKIDVSEFSPYVAVGRKIAADALHKRKQTVNPS